MASKRIKDWATSITSFRTGDVIPVDGPSGTAKMLKDDLLKVTAQNALAGNVAQEFDPTRTSEKLYKIGTAVTYQGKTYVFKFPHYGPWNADHVVRGNIGDLKPLSQSKDFSIVGANLTAQYAYVFLQKGISKISVKASPNPWPTDTIGGSNPNILIIYAVDDAGTETTLRQYGITGTIPEEISINVPQSAVMLKFFIRANYQSVVSFSVVNSTINGMQGQIDTISESVTVAVNDVDDLNVGVFGSASSFAGAGTTALQSKEYKVVGLSQFTVDFSSNGDWPTSQLASGSDKFWLQTNAGGTWTTLVEAGKTSTSKKFVTNIPANATKVRFLVRCNAGTTLQCVVSSTSDQSAFSLVGLGQTVVNYFIRVKPYTEYYLLADKVWNTSGILVNSGILNIYAVDDNFQDMSTLAQTLTPQIPPTEYRFVVPSDCRIVRVMFRATSGERVSFNLSESYSTLVPVDEQRNLLSLSRYNGYELPGVLLMGDPHSSSSAYHDYLKITNKASTFVKAIIVLGDMANDNPAQAGTYDNYKAFVNNCSKPVYPVIGNHDVGSGWGINQYAPLDVVVNNIMSDAVAKGFIPSAPKGYYYVDIGSVWNYKARIIVLNNYNIPGVYDSESLWEQVAYDSSAPQINLNTAYSQGDVVNVGLWTDHSYRATESLTTPSAQPASKVHNYPCWSVRPDAAKIDAEQAQWLLDTMASTPNYTGIVIVQHSTLSTACTKDLSSKFTQKGNVAVEVSGVGDFLVEAAKAFETKNTSFSYTVLGESVSKDFSGRASTASFVGFLGGHQHHDFVIRSTTYPKYYEISANKAMLSYAGDNSDIFTSAAAPSATFVTINRETLTMNLAKIGVQFTQDGYARDIDVVKQEAPPN